VAQAYASRGPCAIAELLVRTNWVTVRWLFLFYIPLLFIVCEEINMMMMMMIWMMRRMRGRVSRSLYHAEMDG